MATIMAVLCSGRRNGYTATLLQEAIEGAKEVEGVEIDYVYLHEYTLSPCKSCFSCIRGQEHCCTQNDDFGKRGEGVLFNKLLGANGIVVADPVHGWGASAMCHLFFERWYPFVWRGDLQGMPFLSVSCATNQGMQLEATRTICRWAFTHGLMYVGQLPVHAAYFEEARTEAKYLGRKLAHAAMGDAKQRKPFANDEERFLAYMDKPWNPLHKYLENLSNGTFTSERSLIEKSLRQGTFERPEAVELLENADEKFREAIRYYRLNNYELANRYLVEASAFWTHATWKEFLELHVIKSEAPTVYRPLPEEGA